jgi:hypothetical protein
LHAGAWTSFLETLSHGCVFTSCTTFVLLHWAAEQFTLRPIVQSKLNSTSAQSGPASNSLVSSSDKCKACKAVRFPAWSTQVRRKSLSQARKVKPPQASVRVHVKILPIPMRVRSAEVHGYRKQGPPCKKEIACTYLRLLFPPLSLLFNPQLTATFALSSPRHSIECPDESHARATRETNQLLAN